MSGASPVRRTRARSGALACSTVYPHAARNRESGYALLMVTFLAAVLAIAATAAAPSLFTQGLREKEEEMIWRGEQYVRAVRSYYRKFGRFPQSVEDLAKKKTGIRFLRQEYRDPMNREDGSWRFIYVGPAGQLIGSVTRTGAIQFQVPQPTAGKPTRPGAAPGPTPTQPGAPAETPQRPSTPTSGPSSPIFGGNIIGVASKVERASLRAYNGRTVYREWEFIWDPTKDAGVVGAPAGPGGGIARPPIQQPRTTRP